MMADGQYSGRAMWVSSDSERKMCAYERNGLCLYIWFKLAYCESKLSHDILAHFEKNIHNFFIDWEETL